MVIRKSKALTVVDYGLVGVITLFVFGMGVHDPVLPEPSAQFQLSEFGGQEDVEVSGGVNTSAAANKTATTRTNNKNQTSAALTHNPQIVGRLDSPALPEISGAIALPDSAEGWWVLNDGGHPAVLFRLLPSGTVSHRLIVSGYRNHDWEDLAHFKWQGRPYALIADTGDNDAVRGEVSLLVLPLPVLSDHELSLPQSTSNITNDEKTDQVIVKSPNDVRGQGNTQLQNKGVKTIRVKPTHRARVKYPDGARDVEAVAVDPHTEKVLLLSKRDAPARLYSLPLERIMSLERKHTAKTVLTPTLETRVDAIADHFKTPFFSALFGFAVTRPTGMDVQFDPLLGVSRLAVLTYSYLYIFDKSKDESYAQALSRDPHVIHLRKLPQAEALALALDGLSVTVFSEGLETPFLRWTLPPLVDPALGGAHVKKAVAP